MDKKPIGRERNVGQGEGKIGRQGPGLGTGPVGNRQGNTGLGHAPNRAMGGDSNHSSSGAPKPAPGSGP